MSRRLIAEFFKWADTDENEYLDPKEVKIAFRELGFTFITDKNVDGLVARGDANSDGLLDVDEFIAVAPSYLRKNCAKMAAKNGNELGLMV